MSIQIKKIESFNEKSVFVEQYFRSIGDSLFIKSLDEFTKKNGFGREPFCNIFHSEYQSWEEEYFGDTGVKFVAYYPTLSVEEQAILSNSEFYELVSKAAERYVQQYPYNKALVSERLEKIKKILEL
jgi:hypothetical protein